MVVDVLLQVIRRVAELQQLVEDAENYLSDADGETTETESVRSDQYGRLKHSDSLLLLTQVSGCSFLFVVLRTFHFTVNSNDAMQADIACNFSVIKLCIDYGLLYLQGQKMLPNGEVVESEERSGSDTDSQSTPNQSPAHRPGMN